MELFPVDLVPPAYRALAEQVARARRARQERVGVINQSFGFNSAEDANRSIMQADERALGAANNLDQFVPLEAIPDYSRVDAIGRQFEDASMQIVPQPVRQQPTIGIGEAIAGLAGSLLDPRGSSRGFDALRQNAQQRNEIDFANEVARYQEENAQRQAILDALGRRMTTEARIADSNAGLIDRNNRTILQQLQGSANVAGRAATEARNRANSYVSAIQNEAELEQKTLKDILTNAANQAKIIQEERKIAQGDKKIAQGDRRLDQQDERLKFDRERWKKDFDEKVRQFGLTFSEKQKENASRRQDSINRLEIARQRVATAKSGAERKAAKAEWESAKKEHSGTTKQTADDKAYESANRKISELRARQKAISGMDAESKKRRKALEDEIAEVSSVRDMYAQTSSKAMRDAILATDVFIKTLDNMYGTGEAEKPKPGELPAVDPFSIEPPQAGNNPLRGNIGGNRQRSQGGNTGAKKALPKKPATTAKPKATTTKKGTKYEILD
jgi:hypothetical protein